MPRSEGRSRGPATPAPASVAEQQPGVCEAALALHRDALVWDMLLPWARMGRRELAERALERLHAGGVDHVSLTVGYDWDDPGAALRTLAAEHAWFRERADRYRVSTRVDDVHAARRDGCLSVGFHFQGCNPFGYEPALVQMFYRLGVSHALVAYNLRNPLGDGCQELHDSGLTRLGRLVVAEMNRVGMLVDVSHTGYRTSMDVFEASTAPVITSHSNPRALCDHTRNIPDDQARACAATGGVIGVVGFATVLGPDRDRAGPELVVRHIDYLCELVGPAHVGLGIDYVYDQQHDSRSVWSPHFSGRPVAVLEPEQYPGLTEHMLARGYDQTTVRGILGENWARVAGEVWR